MKVAVLVPAQHLLDGAGAAKVFASQLSALRAAGWQTTLIAVAPQLTLSARRRRDFRQRVEHALAECDADHRLVCAGTRWRSAPLPVLLMLARRVLRPASLTLDLAVSRLVAPDGAGIAGTFDVAVANYLHGINLLDGLAPRGRQILVLHDLDADEIPPAVCRALNERAQVMTLTDDDARRLADCAGVRTPVLAALPLDPAEPVGAGDLAGPPTLGALMDSCEPERSPPGGWAETAWARRATMDLLFVGSAHPPNVEGLASFTRDCFLPHLAGAGVGLVVAGDVGRAVWPDGQVPEGIAWLGRTERLRPLYAAAKLAVVPLHRGTGVSIKTLEAIGARKPVLASPAGIRGTGLDPSLALAPPFDARWAERIRALLSSRDARIGLRDALANGLEGADHGSVLVGLANAMVGEGPARPMRRRTRPETATLIEWPDAATSSHPG